MRADYNEQLFIIADNSNEILLPRKQASINSLRHFLFRFFRLDELHALFQNLFSIESFRYENGDNGKTNWATFKWLPPIGRRETINILLASASIDDGDDGDK